MVCLPHMRSTATWPPTPQCRYMDQCSTHHPCHCHCHCQYHQQHHYHHDNHCQCHGHYRHPTLSIEHSTSRIHYASIIDHCHNGMPIGTTMWSSVAYNQPTCVLQLSSRTWVRLRCNELPCASSTDRHCGQGMYLGPRKSDLENIKTESALCKPWDHCDKCLKVHHSERRADVA